MMQQTNYLHGDDQSWAIVLAGGEGERLRPAVSRWLGAHCPKQYCTFVGTRSMLQHTWDRSLGLVAESRVLTAIGNGHRRYLRKPACPRPIGTIIEQPRAKGTLPGVLLPLTHIMAQDPEAVVYVFPSDHYVHPENRFRRLARAAALIARFRPDRMTLLGALPEGPVSDYGWIKAGKSNGLRTRVMGVESFIEKPPGSQAQELYRSGAYWNTLILVSKARLLWESARDYFPEMVKNFDEFRRLLVASRTGKVGAGAMRKALDWLYSNIGVADLSTDILEKLPERLLLLPMEGIEWSDWGRPARIEESLGRLGKTPYFKLRPRRYSATTPPGNLIRPNPPGSTAATSAP